MDEKLIEQLLNEEVPEWEYEEFKCSKDKKLININGDNLSVYTDGDEEVESSKMFSISNYGGNTLFSANDIFSVNSSPGNSILSPQSQRRLHISPLVCKKENNHNSILQHRTGKLIKHAILTKVANQISSSKSKANTGIPTCCSRGKYLAIGTSKSITFLFDLKQVLKFYVGMEDGSMNYGAVSSLSFNLPSTRLLVGFVKAHINMWDISGTEGKLLRSINVNQGPGYAISFVRFLPDPTMAVYVDTNGSVFQLIFKRGIGGRSTDLECFFSGSRGEILCLESLFIPKYMKKHELEEYSLLAMASFTKVIVVSCKPQLKVKFMHPLKGKPETMPHIEWSFNTRLTDTDTTSNKEVFLTFARNTDIHILKISSHNQSINNISSDSIGGDLKFELIYHISLDFQILSFKWLNQYFLGFIDFNECFHAFDVRTKTTVETLDMKSVQIIYNTSLFKSTATGGNVSEAMSVAADRACYHSIIEQNGQIKILGQHEMHIVMLRPWMEAIDVIQKTQSPEQAFKICGELYCGNNLTCRQVLMLPYKVEERQRVVTKVALNLIESILDKPPNCLDFQSFFKSMLELCVTIKQITFFTNTVFNKLVINSEMETAFICSIVPLVTNNTIRDLHPELVQRIIEYFQRTEKFQELDHCITKLDISCIDLDKIIKLSTKYRLFSSFIHVYNSAFNDFLTPLKYMMNFISDSSLQDSDQGIKNETVNKAIVYIHCCFAGKDYFSRNTFSSIIMDDVKSNIFEYLIPYEKTNDNNPLSMLLEYNTNEFLNMITLVFDEPFFTSDIGVSRKQATIQRLCDHFISDQYHSSKREVVRFFVFLSRELNKPSNVSVFINQNILDELIERVCLRINDDTTVDNQKTQSKGSFLHKQAETAFINFLKNNPTYREHWLKNERILTLSRKAQFYRVCEFIYRQKKMLHMVLECFLLDPDYRIESFELIESVWNDDNVDEQERCQMMDKCFQLAESLILANETLAVIVLLTICKKRLDEIINKLGGFQLTNKSRNEIIYSFLKSFFIIRNEIEESENDLVNHTTVSQEISNIMKSVKVQNQVAELFIDLLCQFQCNSLQTFLKYSVDYRNDKAITIISKYNLPYSLGFIFEKSKKFDLASDLYIKVFNDLWSQCERNGNLKLENCIISSSIGISFQQCIDVFVQLVKKHKSSSSEIKSFWMDMLHSILQKQSCSRVQPFASMIDVIFTYFVKVLSHEIPMTTIMITILKNPVFTGESFGKIRELVISVMNSFNYEKVLLESCICLMDKDVTNCLIQLNATMGTGVIVADPQCIFCHKNLNYLTNNSSNNNNNIIIFRCGHRYHEDCLKLSMNLDNTGQYNFSETYMLCSLCTTSIPFSNTSNFQLLRATLCRENTPDNKKLANGHQNFKNKNGDILPRNSLTTSTPTIKPHYINNDNGHIKDPHKNIDMSIKLKLAPPNYLLNFCTFE